MPQDEQMRRAELIAAYKRAFARASEKSVISLTFECGWYVLLQNNARIPVRLREKTLIDMTNNLNRRAAKNG